MRRIIAEASPDLVYVNTLTLPWWLVAARSTGVPAICHVHEAEPSVRSAVQRALVSPLVLADRVIANSESTRRATLGVMPRLRSRMTLIHNGVPAPQDAPDPRQLRPPLRLLVVGRLSPAKSAHVAVEALALLRSQGIEATLEICGTPAPGREAYAAELRRRGSQEDVAGRVSFAGYCSPIWPALRRAHVLLAPSTAETFGNTVVEAQMSLRPVVATAVGGHRETVLHEQTGLLVPVGDPAAMAGSVRRLLDEPDLVDRLVRRARERALERFSTASYAEAIIGVTEAALNGRGPART
jgi:glycosyltransferase involved in cell wall biosynthesis